MGNQAFGGDSSEVSSELSGEIDVIKIVGNEYSFAALREDGSVVNWGFNRYFDNSVINSELSGELKLQTYSK